MSRWSLKQRFRKQRFFVNGRKVGAHRGGYVGFPVDITSALHEGDNVIRRAPEQPLAA